MKTLSKILSILLCLTLIVGIIPVMASAAETTVTYDFSSLTGKGTSLTTETALSTLNSCASDKSYLTNVTVANKIYDGNGTGGAFPNTTGLLKTGTGSAKGELTLVFTANVTKVQIECHTWYKTDGTDTVSVNGLDAVTAPTGGTFNTLTFDIAESNTVAFTFNKRVFIKSITLTMLPHICSEDTLETKSDETGHWSICSCGDEATKTAVEPHSYVDHVCECGYEEPLTATLVKSIAPGVAYKFAMVQGNLENAMYYLKGGMDSYYLATTTSPVQAIDVYLEETDGGYYFYTLSGESKLYINIVVGDHVNAYYEETASTIYIWDDTYKTIVATIGGEEYWHCTRNDKTYTTMGPALTSYEGFYGQFYCVEHDWADATCTAPKTCKTCATTEGEALGHDWDNATCTTPKTCKVCNATEGEALGHKDEEGGAKDYICDVCGTELCTDHDWADPTCTAPKTCKICGEVDSTAPALGHDMAGATCTAPKTCKREGCNHTEGEALGHDLSKATCTTAATCQREGCSHVEGTALGHDMANATCTAPKTCKREGCNHTEGEALGHKLNKVAAKEATTEAAGNKEHWVCETCEKLFADAEGKTETTKQAVTIAKLPTEEEISNTTVTTVIGDYATANGWENSTLYESLNMDSVISVTVAGTPVGEWGQNTGKFYSSDNSWRIYQNETPSVTITAANGTIVSVKITYTSSKGGVLTLNGANVEPDQVVTVNGTSVTFGVANTGDATNGQARITAIEVLYSSTGSGTVTPPADDDKEEDKDDSTGGNNQDATPGNPEPPKSETVNASTAVAGDKGTIYTVKGVVTLLDGQNVYIQDSTGGICVRFSSKDHGIKMGDTIIATGKLDFYNGLPQLASASFEKSEGLNLWASKKTIDSLTTADIGKYINLSGVKIVEIFDNDGKYTNPNITVEDAEGNQIQIYKAVIGKNADGTWVFKVGDIVNINAAVSVYKETLQLRNTYASEIVDASSVPATGDASLISVFVALLAVSGMGLTAAVAKKKEF